MAGAGTHPFRPIVSVVTLFFMRDTFRLRVRPKALLATASRCRRRLCGRRAKPAHRAWWILPPRSRRRRRAGHRALSARRRRRAVIAARQCRSFRMHALHIQFGRIARVDRGTTRRLLPRRCCNCRSLLEGRHARPAPLSPFLDSESPRSSARRVTARGPIAGRNKFPRPRWRSRHVLLSEVRTTEGSFSFHVGGR